MPGLKLNHVSKRGHIWEKSGPDIQSTNIEVHFHNWSNIYDAHSYDFCVFFLPKHIAVPEQ